MNTYAMIQFIEFLCYTFELERSSDEERFQKGKEFFDQKASEVTDLDNEDNYNYCGSLMEAAYHQEEFVGMLRGVKERVRQTRWNGASVMSRFWVTSPDPASLGPSYLWRWGTHNEELPDNQPQMHQRAINRLMASEHLKTFINNKMSVGEPTRR